MTSSSKYRSRMIANTVIDLSISYQRENLLARGLGLEHLRELLVRLARPLLRQAASLAYGGHWKESEDNFTFDLLRLISAEQEDNSLGGPDTNLNIGRLVNHCPWPEYLEVTPRIEAQWINCCRIVRVTQQDAGIGAPDQVPDGEAGNGSDRAVFNRALTLSAMRRLAMDGMTIDLPGLPSPEFVPPIMARVVLGGKTTGFHGFLPGIFEEALVALERRRPLYILGGFGGAAEALAGALLARGPDRPPALVLDALRPGNPGLDRLLELATRFALPPGARASAAALDALFALVDKGRGNLPAALNTGLDEIETREMLTTRDVSRAVQLVRKGLTVTLGLGALAE